MRNALLSRRQFVRARARPAGSLGRLRALHGACCWSAVL